MKIAFKENEFWWGGVIHDGRLMPIGKNDFYAVNLSKRTAGNQSVPFFLSTKGRYIYNNKPLSIIFENGTIITDEGVDIIQSSGNTLSDAYREAMHTYFPFTGKVPETLFFSAPQYNTWAELTYGQNQESVLAYRPYNLHDQEEPECIPDSEQLRAGIWISYSPDLIFWGKHRPLVYPESISKYANWKMGPTPPIKTKEGWLEIIHGVFKENGEFCYSIGVMLLDLDDPQKIIGVSDNWILTPTESYETNGRVENVVFPCGAIADHETDTLRIYYGAADTCIGLATGKISELVAACKAGQTASESIAERQ